MRSAPDLRNDPIVPLFFKYYIPALTGLLSITVNQVIDGIILGKFVGKSGVAAVGLFGPVVTVFIAALLILVIGGGIFLSKGLGAGDKSIALRVFNFTTTWVLVIALATWICSPVAPTILADLLAGKEDTALYQDTREYMFWAFLWTPILFIRVLWSSLVNHDNAPHIARNASLIAVIVNIIFNLILVAGLQMGVKGASVATGIAVTASVLYLIQYLWKAPGNLSIRDFRLKFYFKGWKKLFSHGLPTFISEISFSGGLLLINTSLVNYGTDAVAAFGIISYLSFIFLRFFTSVMVSALPVMSFNLGAGNGKRVLQTLGTATIFSFVLGLAVMSAGFLFPEWLITTFSATDDIDFLTYAGTALSIFFLFFPVAGPNYVLSAYLQTTEKLYISILLNFMKGFALVWVFIYLMPDQLEGTESIWFARPFAEIMSFLIIGLFTLLLYKRYYRIPANAVK